MLDDLRKSAEGSGYEAYEDETYAVVEDRSGAERKFLGMTAVERMFLAIFIFLNVLVVGLALLLFTGRIVL